MMASRVGSNPYTLSVLILPGGEAFPQTLLHDSSLSTETLVQLTTKQIFAEHLLGGNLALYELLN